MDLSKLPRLSKSETPAPAPVETPAPQPPAGAPTVGAACPYCAAPLRAGARFCDNCGSALRIAPQNGGGAVGMGAEAWISIGIGILLLLFVPTTLKYAASKVFHTKFTPYVDPDTNEGVDYVSYTDGTKIHYRDQIEYWSNMAVTAFAIALIVEGIALTLSRRPAIILFALFVTVTATIFNLVYFIATFNKYGIAPISALAVIFGGYMAMYQFSLLQSGRRESQK